jgi:hypothetical protein
MDPLRKLTKLLSQLSCLRAEIETRTLGIQSSNPDHSMTKEGRASAAVLFLSKGINSLRNYLNLRGSRRQKAAQ